MILYAVRYYYALDISHIVGPPMNLCNEDTPVECFKIMCNRFYLCRG